MPNEPTRRPTLHASVAALGAILGALGAAVVYGLIGMVTEWPPLALSIGAISGGLAVQFGGQRDLRLGVFCAGISLGAVLLAKWALIGAGDHAFWEAHGGLSDIVFGYVATPLLALMAATGIEPGDPLTVPSSR